jgi:hypothetical protein
MAIICHNSLLWRNTHTANIPEQVSPLPVIDKALNGEIFFEYPI